MLHWVSFHQPSKFPSGKDRDGVDWDSPQEDCAPHLLHLERMAAQLDTCRWDGGRTDERAEGPTRRRPTQWRASVPFAAGRADQGNASHRVVPPPSGIRRRRPAWSSVIGRWCVLRMRHGVPPAIRRHKRMFNSHACRSSIWQVREREKNTGNTHGEQYSVDTKGSSTSSGSNSSPPPSPFGLGGTATGRQKTGDVDGDPLALPSRNGQGEER
ncbi:hypothetical protein LZ30DRAFT_707657 [Colletotrichum cereale]|nr:hypothetical protein LZ30DRAFT_707657 [Colletotrichum cereale]